MADMRPTKIGFFRGCHFCVLGVFSPKRLLEEQDKDNEVRRQFSDREERKASAIVLCRAFWLSLVLVVLSSAVGFVAGKLIGRYGGCISSEVVTGIQALGAMLLLWGTLFIRGWEIQTYCGVTLVERVNRWIYRALCCMGTVVFVFSIALPLCVK